MTRIVVMAGADEQDGAVTEPSYPDDGNVFVAAAVPVAVSNTRQASYQSKDECGAWPILIWPAAVPICRIIKNDTVKAAHGTRIGTSKVAARVQVVLVIKVQGIHRRIIAAETPTPIRADLIVANQILESFSHRLGVIQVDSCKIPSRLHLWIAAITMTPS